MALLKKSEMNALGAEVSAFARKSESVSLEDRILQDVLENKTDSYDIFLSHSYADKQAAYGVKRFLERKGYSVYIDWIEDTALDRSSVTEATATLLQTRMQNSRCLLYATSSNSTYSKWMPWECGYVDGHSGRVAIAPLAHGDELSYQGQEYLGIYPYLDHVSGTLWINAANGGHCRFDDWINGKDP